MNSTLTYLEMAGSILGSLPFPIFVVNQSDRIAYLNGAAEQFFDQGASRLLDKALQELIPFDSPVFDLINNVRNGGMNTFEYGIDVEIPRGGGRGLMVSASPMSAENGDITISIHQQFAAKSLERQLEYRQSARSVSAMASMLAHEVKNPLSGIRGAAQLLERSVSGADQSLARLIQDETDRVCSLVDRMDVFADGAFTERKSLNVHEVLQRAIDSASVGFGKNVTFATDFDPSLPEVDGNFDVLVQVFLNLVKNASEALNGKGGQITIKSAYRRGVSLVMAGGLGRVHLPLCISIADNGPGVPESIARTLFDPFVTTKSQGTGLGLAFVAKAVDDHGGMIECDSSSLGAEFRIYLPIRSHTKRIST
ncbi:MAG: ATP-binding protein [Rhodospirillaceae bacterium]